MKLTTKQLPDFRREMWEAQGRCCKLTGEPLALENAVVDHCHVTGVVRGVLSRGANTMLGKIENHRRLAGFKDDRKLALVLHNIVGYIVRGQRIAIDPDAAIYPTHKTPEEKRILRNARARKARAPKKGT